MEVDAWCGDKAKYVRCYASPDTKHRMLMAVSNAIGTDDDDLWDATLAEHAAVWREKIRRVLRAARLVDCADASAQERRIAANVMTALQDSTKKSWVALGAIERSLGLVRKRSVRRALTFDDA